VWRPAFAHRERSPAFVKGWRRRFWQGSTDHRGVPGAPGRVVTLVPAPALRDGAPGCWGMAYRVAPADEARVLSLLDHRERGGYERVAVDLYFDAGSPRPVTAGLMYVATESNPNYLGPAPLDAIARQVMASCGPSGPNPEYVSRLAAALEEICPGLDAAGEDALALAALLPAQVPVPSLREPGA